jgi:ribosomal protein S18 acetylase RimI-like enzyme
VVEYRPFHNSDPPVLRRLWHECGLGRGAATGFDADILETTVFAQPYFDHHGLILAVDRDLPVGFVHAGFGPNAAQDALDPRTGVICAVMVAPSHRRQGIGRELIARAEQYLRERGATTILAGAATPNDPFYCGLYGGGQGAGWLESDPLAAPFITALGYRPELRTHVLQRSLADKSDPIGLRLMGVKRTTRLGTAPSSVPRSWWWQTRPGRLDTIDFVLTLKSGSEPVASVTVLGLDFYLPRWEQRAIAVMDLVVPVSLRTKGYGQALLVEVCKRLRDEMITLAEAHVPEQDAAARRVFESAGFRLVDAGVVYQRPASP